MADFSDILKQAGKVIAHNAKPAHNSKLSGGVPIDRPINGGYFSLNSFDTSKCIYSGSDIPQTIVIQVQGAWNVAGVAGLYISNDQRALDAAQDIPIPFSFFALSRGINVFQGYADGSQPIQSLINLTSRHPLFARYALYDAGTGARLKGVRGFNVEVMDGASHSVVPRARDLLAGV